MEQKQPTQLRGAVARDFGFSQVPKTSGVNSGFGPGYAIGFFTCFAAVLASFALIAFGSSEVARGRGIGFLLVSFGSAFMFGVLYSIFTSKGIPWSASLFGSSSSGILTSKNNPAGFWLFAMIAILICCALIGTGAWIIFEHAAAIGSKLK